MTDSSLARVRRIAAACESFRAALEQYSPSDVWGQCFAVCCEWGEALEDAGVFSAEELREFEEGVGWPLARFELDGSQPHPDVYGSGEHSSFTHHYVFVLDGMVWDWTARMFDADATVPHRWPLSSALMLLDDGGNMVLRSRGGEG